MFTDVALLADMFEWADGNPLGEDRRGITVSIVDNGKIIPTKPLSEVFGVVIDTEEAVAFIANMHEGEWHAKHLKDSFGRCLYEDQTLVTWVRDGRRETHETDRLSPGLVIPSDAEYWTHWPATGKKLERPVLNPRFNDGSQGAGSYLGRHERPEWAAVAIIGKAVVRPDQVKSKSWTYLKDDIWFIR